MSAVLKDLAEAEPRLRADAAIDKIVVSRSEWERRRPKALTARECLVAQDHELAIVLDYCNRVAAREHPTQEDHDRFLLAIRRLATIRQEALR